MRKALVLMMVAFGVVSAGWAAAAVAADPPAKAKPNGKGAVHVDISAIGRDGTTRALAVDKGEVVSASATSLTVKRPGAGNVTIPLDASTVIRGRAPLTVAALVAGAKVAVFSRDGKAFLVLCRCKAATQAGPPATPPTTGPRQKGGDKGRLQRPKLLKGAVHADIRTLYMDGSTDSRALDRGEITVLGAGSVTLKRPDGKTVTLKIDAQTVVRSKRQTVTLAALKVGDRAAVLSRSGTAFLIRGGAKKAK